MFLQLNNNYIDCSFWRTYGSGAQKKRLTKKLLSQPLIPKRVNKKM